MPVRKSPYDTFLAELFAEDSQIKNRIRCSSFFILDLSVVRLCHKFVNTHRVTTNQPRHGVREETPKACKGATDDDTTISGKWGYEVSCFPGLRASRMAGVDEE